jgi:hypothetical protein
MLANAGTVIANSSCYASPEMQPAITIIVGQQGNRAGPLVDLGAIRIRAPGPALDLAPCVDATTAGTVTPRPWARFTRRPGG